MSFIELEKIFNRSFLLGYSKKRFLFLFPVLFISGLSVILCRALAIKATGWVLLSLSFVPFFLCGAALFAVGIILSRFYYLERKWYAISLKQVIADTWHVLIAIPYLTVPLLLIYLIVWSLMGFFYLLHEAPLLGDFFGVIFSFGPFLLTVVSLLLCILHICLLFFLTPLIAFKKVRLAEIPKRLLEHFAISPFINLLFLLIALSPAILVTGVLMLSASLTGATFAVTPNSFALIMQWFIIMIPFSALLTPAIVFFFNFASESFFYLQKNRIRAA